MRFGRWGTLQYSRPKLGLVKEVAINRFHFKVQLLSATRQNSGEFILVTHFRCDGIFNNSFIANFQGTVKVKKNCKSVSI